LLPCPCPCPCPSLPLLLLSVPRLLSSAEAWSADCPLQAAAASHGPLLPRLPHGLPTACPPTKANLCAPTKFTHAKDTHPSRISLSSLSVETFSYRLPNPTQSQPLNCRSTLHAAPLAPPCRNHRHHHLLTEHPNIMRQLQQTFQSHA
jgi:hypothetical protein